MVDNTQLPFSEGSFILEKQLISGLIQNRETYERWEKRKREHEELKSNLSFYAERLKKTIFVPLGNKAMMRAELIHTNEITVSLGQGWFVKVSAKDAIEICQRRINECDEVLKKCEAERSLFESRTDVKLRDEAFGGKEIIEAYDENEEAKWREEHKEKVRKHKSDLAEIKNKIKQNPSKTEEDLWKQLDLLEMEEELEDELARMGNEEDEEEMETDSEETDSDDYESNEQEDSIPVKNDKKVRFGLDPVTEVIESKQDSAQEVTLVETTAVKDTITESNPTIGANTVKTTRPTSKFKKSRQGGVE